MTKRSFLVFSLILAMALLSSGCTPVKSQDNAMQELKIALGDDPVNLDPQLANDILPMTIVNAVFEGLLRKDGEGLPAPGLAKSWDISSDKLTYTFHLRDALWADGSKVTAGDFRSAWLRALDPKPEGYSPSYTSYLLYSIKGAKEYNGGEGSKEDVGVTVKDPLTLVVSLNKPSPYFLDLLCSSVYMPVNNAFYDKVPKKNGITGYGLDAAGVLGNGPFKLTEWKHNEGLHLVKNENYWNKNEIRLKDVRFKIIRDASAAYAEFKSGGVDLADISGQQMEDAAASSYEVKSFDSGSTTIIGFNNKDSIIKNANIRKALAYSIDRSTLVKNVFKENSISALGFVSPSVKGFKAAFRSEAGDLFKDNDVSKAGEMLARGLKELNLPRLPSLTMLVEDKETAKRDAQAYQEMWKKSLGLDIKIETMPFDAMMEKLFKFEYQIALPPSWGSDYNDPLGFLEAFESSNINNLASYSSERYDEILKASDEESDSSKRINMLAEAEKLLISEDMAICPVYFSRQNYTAHKKVRGLIRGSSSIQNLDFCRAYIEN